VKQIGHDESFNIRVVMNMDNKNGSKGIPFSPSSMSCCSAMWGRF
jgi:hypothetical protein